MLSIEGAYVCIAASLIFAAQGWGADLSADDAVKLMADRLEKSQVADGPELGAWPGEEGFTGTTTAGMVRAYEWTGNASYRTAAQSGALYSIVAADIQGNVMGDVAYALATMSEVSKRETPEAEDIWREVLVAFYDSIRDPRYEGSTKAYIRYFDDVEPSTSVFYLAYHVLATASIGDPDKDVWRNALIAHLSRVDDESAFPVMALGAATWALARTGKLDDTPVSWYWRDGATLRDLPALLLSHHVPKGEPYEGSFYWRCDHANGAGGEAAAGFTEDTVYGALGLVAAASLSKSRDEDVEQAITAVDDALLKGVDTEGKVYEHLSCQGETYHVFAGEMLQALWSVKQHLADMQTNVPVAEGVPVPVSEKAD